MAQLGSTKVFGDLQVTGQATLDRPKISTGIFDINGNEVLNIVPTTAAVNELSIKNAAAGGDVLLTTAGTDTNINLLVQTKGTGAITLDTGAGAGSINLKSGADSVRFWDDDSSHYYQFLTGNRTANYSITLPAATGTMLIANSTANTAGYFDTSTTTPTGTTRLNYSGYFYPTYLNLIGSADTATAATNYYVETGSDGFVRPKTLANVKTEIVTTAAVNAAAATTVGTITSGVWNGTAISVAKGGTGATTAAAALTNLGITATAAELNKLDGVTATATEINYIDGVTSAIQTQLNGKLPLDGSTTGSAIKIARDGASADNYGAIGVTRGTASNFSYYSLTRAGQIAWNLGVNTSNAFHIGTGTAGLDGIITSKMSLDQSGNLVAIGNITAYSDERLKSNIITLPNALEKVMALRGVEFDKDGTHNIGVIAQEVQKIIPEVVLDGEYLSVAYGNMVGLLIEAIKEQQTQIEELKALVGK